MIIVPGSRSQRGQSAVEFALILSVSMIVLFVAVQFAVIGQAALALGQLTYQGARYAAAYTACTDTGTPCGPAGQSIDTYMQSVEPATIQYLTGKSATALNITMNPTGPRSFGNPVTISCTLNVSGLLFLSNPFLGVSFPGTLSSAETALSE